MHKIKNAIAATIAAMYSKFSTVLPPSNTHITLSTLVEGKINVIHIITSSTLVFIFLHQTRIHFIFCDNLFIPKTKKQLALDQVKSFPSRVKLFLIHIYVDIKNFNEFVAAQGDGFAVYITMLYIQLI